MKKVLLLIGIALSLNCMTQAKNNPLLSAYKTPFGTPPFDKIKTEHYEPAFDEGIKQLDE